MKRRFAVPSFLMRSGVTWMVITVAATAHAQAPEPTPDPDADATAPDATAPDTEPAPDPDAPPDVLDSAGDPVGEPDQAPEPAAPIEAQAPVPEAPEAPAPASEPAPAPAETSDAPPPVAPDEEEIVVTGSRIKRSVFSSTSPVSVMTRREIEQSGASNTADLIQNLNIQAGSGFLGGNEGESNGTARVALRGFNAGATLVLINGRRTVPSAAGVTVAFTDIGTIPLAVIERIEILKSGASAIYGTDAIAGVINIITRKDWEGMRVQLDGRAATRGFNYREGTASAAIGASGENARVLVGLQYYRATQLFATDRDFTSEEGPPGGQGGNRSLIGLPGSYLVNGGLSPDPDCARAPGSREEANGLCSFSFNAFRSLTPDLERASAFAYGEYDFSDYTRALLEVNVSRTRTENVSSPSFRVLGNPVVPADHIDNPFGADAVFIGRPLGAASGGTTQSNDDDTLRTAIGLQGELGGIAANTAFEDWGWDVTTSFGVSRYQRFLPDELGDNFQAALSNCSDPNNLAGCFNPFYSATLGTGTPNSDEVIESFTGALMAITDQHLQTYGAGLNGDLFRLPGGEVGFAVGGELRREQRSAQLDHDSNEFALSFYFGDEDGYADRDILAGYLELLWPFLKGLELQTAARVESYSEGWETFNPFAGVIVNAGELAGSDQRTLTGLKLRANISRAFRAPALFQSFNGSTTIPRSLDDGGASPVYVPVRRLGNPDLEPERATVITAGFTWEPMEELLLEADYWNYGYEDYIATENEQAILSQMLATGNPDPRIERDMAGVLERTTVSWINLPGDINTHGIDARARLRLGAGGAGTFSLGLDGTLMFAFMIPKENSENGEWVVPDVPEGGAPSFCDGDTCDVAGNFNEANPIEPLPTWRLNVPLTWELEEHMAGFILHVMSPLEDWAPSRYMGGPRDIDAFVTLDFQYALTLGNVLGRMTKLRVGVLNLLDQAPPFIDTLDSFSTQIHDPRGRMVYASLTQEL